MSRSLSEFIECLNDLKQRERRLFASRALAKMFGAEDLMVFVEDPIVRVFLPAQGFPQTLPSGKDWRAFLETARKDENTFCDLVSPYSKKFEIAKGYVVSEKAMVVFLGARTKISLAEDERNLFGLVAAALVGETALLHTQGQAKMLRESVEMYRTLTSSLEITKKELQLTLQERKQANEADVKLLNGSLKLLSTLDYDETMNSIVDTAAANLCDWSVIYLRRDKSLMQVEAGKFAARNAEDFAALQDYVQKFPVVSGGSTPVGQVLDTHSEKIFMGLSEGRIMTLTETSDQGQALERCRPRAILAHPMKHGGEFIGVLVYGFVDHRREITTHDILLAQRWTAQATSALTNANLLKEAQRALQARDELTSISSHELRTPITAMKLQIQLAKRQIKKRGVESLSGSDVEKIVEQSDRQLAKLVRLVDDMMDLARINTGQFSINLKQVNFSEVIRDTLERMLPNLVGAGCEVRTDIAPGVHIQGDDSRLEQVLTNLLTNAARYGAGHPVDVGLSVTNKLARLVVRDHGIGIAKPDLDRIFGKFERAISYNEVSGLGLGLFIVRQILEAHKGAIRVDSETGQGATFIVEIPLAVAE